MIDMQKRRGNTFVEDLKRALARREQQTVTFTQNPLWPAAILLPLYEKEGEYYIILTKRTEELEYHKGQICFPGGTRDGEEEELSDTALRETYEEIGVRPEDVEILGQLDRMGTVTSNFLITPYVGIIPYPYDFIVSSDEIAELIQMPLLGLKYDSKYWEETYTVEGVTGQAGFFEYGDKVIWGATARILKQLLDLIYTENGDSIDTK
jgi:8-oxo-dGTP pyrophosphatase MutT (NUDIX family)